jgi:hypothetical protein
MPSEVCHSSKVSVALIVLRNLSLVRKSEEDQITMHSQVIHCRVCSNIPKNSQPLNEKPRVVSVELSALETYLDSDMILNDPVNGVEM